MMMHLSSASIFFFFIFIVVVQSLKTERPTRRSWIVQSTTGWLVAATTANSLAGAEVVELPPSIKPLTKLAPLGPSSSSTSNDNKTKGLSLPELAQRLEHDLVVGSSGTSNGYFLSGDISTDIFRDDCIFSDPTNEVQSLSRYQRALRILFDPETSVIELLPPGLTIQDRAIRGRVRSRGFLQLPWKPFITAYESDIVYKVDDDGLIARQDQTWSKTAQEALQETFTPTLFTPPPRSTLKRDTDEPEVVTRLFDMVNGRRPKEYSPSEELEMNSLINKIAKTKWEWNAHWLPGKWMLVYLQPGPNGAGVDRRVPFFPEFNFNDQYQQFTVSGVENIGEVWGARAAVTVAGTLQEQNQSQVTTPKRYVARIQEGSLCYNNPSKNNHDKYCLPLPISGKGLFDGIYLGKRLRIGQNINGGGARVVQVRID